MTDEEKGFIEMIRKEPEEETHKLVYADWLEEHGGRPDAAGYIRRNIRAGTSRVDRQSYFSRVMLKQGRWFVSHQGIVRQKGDADATRRLLPEPPHHLWAIDKCGPEGPAITGERIYAFMTDGVCRHVSCSPEFWMHYGQEFMRHCPITDVAFGRQAPIKYWRSDGAVQEVSFVLAQEYKVQANQLEGLECENGIYTERSITKAVVRHFYPTVRFHMLRCVFCPEPPFLWEKEAVE